MRGLTLLLSVVVVVAVALGASGAASPSGSAKARWVITDLGTLGGKLSEAVAINELGHVVGNSADASGRERAFLWRDGKMITLRFGDPNWPREPGRANWAVGINDADQVIGEDAERVGGPRGHVGERESQQDLLRPGHRDQRAWSR